MFRAYPLTVPKVEKIPAFALVTTLKLLQTCIDEKLKSLYDQGLPHRTESDIKELQRLAEEQGSIEYMQYISRTYGFSTQVLLSQILVIINGISNEAYASIYTHGTYLETLYANPNKRLRSSIELTSCQLGVLTTKSHQKLEHEYEMAFQTISSLLKEFYGISSIIPVLSIRQYLVESKAALNASLEITKHEMLDKLQQSPVPFYMVTICCDDPETVELTKVEQEDCIETMRNAQSNILHIDFGRRNFRSTPRSMPA